MPAETFQWIELGCTPTACSGCLCLSESCEFYTRISFDAVELQSNGMYESGGIVQIDFSGTLVTQFSFIDNVYKTDDPFGNLEMGFYEVFNSSWKSWQIKAAQKDSKRNLVQEETRHFIVKCECAKFQCLAEEYHVSRFERE